MLKYEYIDIITIITIIITCEVYMRIEQLMSKLFGFSTQTYFNWKKEQRPILTLLAQYIPKNDLEEFLETGKVSKFEMVEEFKMLLQGAKLDYLGFLTKNLKHSNKLDVFTDFYYRFLVYTNEIRNNPKDSDIEFQNIFQLNDALPSFLIKNNFTNLNEMEMYKLQYKIRQINHMDQNTTNLILLNISNDFQFLVKQTIGQISDEYRKSGIIHSLMFCIYKYHPNLNYEEKIKLLGKVLNTDAIMIFEVFEKILWKSIEVEYDKIVEAIKAYR